MGNKATQKIIINKERFLEVLKLRNCSIRKLGDDYEQIQRTEKTIRRCLNKGEMPPELLNRIAKYLNVHPNYLSGAYDNKANQIGDDYLRTLSHSFIKPENYPYLLKAKQDIQYTTYFENILTTNNISMELFNTLSPIDRVMFRQELVVSILEVIARYFTFDSLGNDLAQELDYYKSFMHDFDPFSYFAELEGIGIAEPNISYSYEVASLSSPTKKHTND